MNCQILKLKSGEEIICEIIEQTKTKCTIKDPFAFKPIVVMDMTNGQPIDMITIKDWLIISDCKTTTIPTNHVASFIIPSKDSIILYTKEKKRIATLLKKPKKKSAKALPPVDPATEEDLRAQADQYGADFFNMMEEMLDKMLPEDKHTNDTEDMDPHLRRRGPMIHMSMVFPPEVIIELMEAGIINVNDLKKIAKDVKKKMKYTGDEKHRTDFGNKFSDWSIDPEHGDYK